MCSTFNDTPSAPQNQCNAMQSKSLLWMMALVGMLVVPPILIVVVNGALMRIVVTAYL